MYTVYTAVPRCAFAYSAAVYTLHLFVQSQRLAIIQSPSAQHTTTFALNSSCSPKCFRKFAVCYTDKMTTYQFQDSDKFITVKSVQNEMFVTIELKENQVFLEKKATLNSKQ